MEKNRVLRDVIAEIIKQPPVDNQAVDHPTGRSRVRKAEPNELLIQVPRLQMIRDEETVRVHLKRPNLSETQKVMAILRTVFNNIDDGQEHIFLVTLDQDCKFINAWDVTKGGIDHVTVNKAELFKRILASDNASCWIIAHNHTSGVAEMSDDDKAMLDDLRRGGLYLDRPMRDFIVMGDGTDKYYSHREQTYEL